MPYASDQPRNMETILVVLSFGERPKYNYKPSINKSITNPLPYMCCFQMQRTTRCRWILPVTIWTASPTLVARRWMTRARCRGSPASLPWPRTTAPPGPRTTGTAPVTAGQAQCHRLLVENVCEDSAVTVVCALLSSLVFHRRWAADLVWSAWWFIITAR